MATIGQIRFDIIANASKFVSEINKVQKALGSFNQEIRKAAGAGKRGPFAFPQGFMSQIKIHTKAMSELATATERAAVAMKEMGLAKMGGATKVKETIAPTTAPDLAGPGVAMGKTQMEVMEQLKPRILELGMAYDKTNVSFRTLKDGMIQGSIKMDQGVSKSFGSIIKKAFNLRNLFGMIAHYLTFTIGVQMVMALRNGIQQMIETFSEFERSATNAATVAGYLGSSFEKVRDHIMQVSQELGRTTVFSAQKVADAFYNLASAGYDVADMTEKDLQPILDYAAATQSELSEATYSVATAMKAFGLAIEDTERIVDTFTATITNSFMTFEKMQEAMKYVGPIAGAIGVELEEVSAALAVLTDTGLTGSQAGQRLNMIFTKLLKPTDEAVEMLEGMGLTVQDLNPEIYSLTEILYKLKAANFDAGTAANMFRARTAAAAAVLVDSADKVSEYNSMLKSSAGITKSVAQTQTDTLWGSLTLLQNAFSETAIEIGNKLSPFLRELAGFIKDSVLPALSVFIGFLQKNWNIIKTLIVAYITWKGTLMAVRGIVSGLLTLKTLYLALLGKEIAREAILTSALGKELAARLISNKLTKAQTVLKQAYLALSIKEDQALRAKAAFMGIYNKQLTAEAAARMSLNPNLATTALLQRALTIAKEEDIPVTEALSIANVQLSAAQKTAAASAMALKVAIPVLLAAAVAVLAVSAYFNTLNRDFGSLGDTVKKAGIDLDYLATELSMLEVASWAASNSSMGFADAVAYLSDKELDWVSVNERAAESLGSLAEMSTLVSAMNVQQVKSTKELMNPLDLLTETFGGLGILGRGILDSESLYREGEALEQMSKSMGGIGGQLASLGAWAKKELSGIFMKNTQQEAISSEAVASTVEFASKRIAEALHLTDKAYADRFDSMEELVNYGVDLKRMTHLLIGEEAVLQDKLGEVSDASRVYRLALEKVNDMKAEGISDSQAFIDAENELIEAEEKLNEVNQDLINSIGGLLQEVRNYSEAMDDAVGYLEEYYKSLNNVSNIIDDIAQARQRETDLVLEYAEALGKYGANSKEAQEKEVELASIAKDIVDRMIEQEEATTSAAQAQSMWNTMMSETGYTANKTYNELIDLGYSYQEITKMVAGNTNVMAEWLENKDEARIVTIKATAAERDLMEITEAFMELRETLTSQTEEQLKLEAQQAAYMRLLEEATKITNEHLKHYLEAQDKIYEIELKLYKLRKDEGSQLSDLFETLAEQGMINDEIIEGFKELKEAEGEVLELNKGFMDAIDGLNDAQREEVEEFMNTEAGTAAYAEELADLQDLVSQGIITQEELDTIIAYNDAQDNLTNTTQKYKDILGPIMDSLIDQGIISSEAAEAWYDIADNAYEAAEAELELGLANNALSESMQGVIKNAATMGKALIDSTVNASSVGGLLDEQRDLFDVYGEGSEHAGKTVAQVMLENLGIWDEFGGSMDGVISTLENFYGMNMDQILEEYGQAGIISAASMIQMGNAIGVWEQGMTEAALAEELGIENMEAFRNAAASAWDTTDGGVGTLAEINETLEKTNDILIETRDSLQKTLEMILKLQGVDLNSMETAIQINFTEMADLQQWRDNFNAFLKDMEENDVIFTPDMTVSWDETDWETFDEVIGTSILGKSFAKSLNKKFGDIFKEVPSNINEWKGDDWEEIFNTEEAKDWITKSFAGMEELLDFDVKWDGYDWNTWIGKLTSTQISQLSDIFHRFSAEFKLDTKWDGKNWQTFLSAIPTEYIPALEGMMPEGIKLPFAADMSTVKTTVEGTTFMLGNLEYTVDKDGIIDQIGEATKSASPQEISIRPNLTQSDINTLFTSLSDEDKKKLYFPSTPLGGVAFFRNLVGTDKLNITKLIKTPTLEEFNAMLPDLGALDKELTLNFLWSQASQDAINSVLNKSANLMNGTTDDIPSEIERKVKVKTDTGDSENKLIKIIRLIGSIPANVSTMHTTYHRDVYQGGNHAEGGILGLQKGIKKTSGPTFAMIGEKGAEAVIPLEGINRKYGEKLLRYIIPKYYPDLIALQRGGVTGGEGPIDYGDTTNENVNVYGPINLNNVTNADAFMSELKYRSRASR